MKISKLFHWLYALVMLLPIFAIGVTTLVSTFNMSTKQESEIHYKYETNEVNSANDLVEGNIYNLNYSSTDNKQLISCYALYNLKIKRNERILTLNYDILGDVFIVSSADNGTTLRVTDEAGYVVNNITNVLSWNFDVVIKNLIDLTTTALSITDFNVIDNIETHNIEPQEVFYRAISKVQQSPLFNWAYDSFLVAPFAYIVNLFSMPTNSFVVMLLSYWLAISIIWLVFDLVMYVPLLVHRWLDKGVLE